MTADLPPCGGDVRQDRGGQRRARHSKSCVHPLGSLAALVVLFITFLTSLDPAFAHAALIRSDPADGSVTASAPTRLTLTFSEPVSPLVLKLVQPDGTTLALDDWQLGDATLAIVAPKEMSRGTHVLSWRVVSADGHPVGGSVVFSVGAPSTAGAPELAPAADRPVSVSIWAARLLLYAGLFFGVGGSFFLAWIGPGSARTRRFVLASLGLGLAAAPLSIGLQGLDALRLPLCAVTGSSAWKTGFETSYGNTAVIAMVALSAGLGALLLRGIAAKWLGLAALLCVGLALAASGHASAASPQWLTRPAVFLHGVGIAFWAGAMVPLGALFFGRGRDVAPALQSFSRAAPFAIAPLVAAGLALAVVQVETPSALFATSYGRILIVKLVLLVFLFGLAVLNRWRLSGPVCAGDQPSMRRLAGSVAIETVLIAAILATAGLWRFTPPPRALAIEAAMPASVHIHAEQAMADISVAPGRAGPVDVSIFVMAGDFSPLPAKEVMLALSKPDAGIEPVKRRAALVEGVWRIDGLQIPLAGRWKVRLDILISDFEAAKLESEIVVRP